MESSKRYIIQDQEICEFCNTKFEIFYTDTKIKEMVYCPFCGVKLLEEKKRVGSVIMTECA